MSTVPEATMAGGNPAEEARLAEPSDAVPLENVAQQAAEGEPSADDAKPGPADQEGTSKPAEASQPTAKGKERDTTASAPLAERQDSGLAIGPAQDDINAITPSGPEDPVCNITLLLTTGSRHPYRLDAKYLSRRNVAMPEQTDQGQPDPFSISIYTLKELILREWRSDWEAKPASPSSIRLIHFGKLLDDKEPLKKYQFSTESPNVVHMSVRPQDLDEEEPKTGSKNPGSGANNNNQQGSRGCCVIL
ncbi:ubiquitin-related domain-containing protein [Stachybotrys elegans]|uniref:Ubiquitin-related domain-containing protein n=1 Tax=Stachybotrys elegans TaxID=80388 RepID=A0A8K0T3R1_9HYPO|nr:ubiquitin-related domain-containing protein [Stachybotrys elegans]